MLQDMHRDRYTMEDKNEWLRTVQVYGEDLQDPKRLSDAFAVQWPLRQWLGLSS